MCLYKSCTFFCLRFEHCDNDLRAEGGTIGRHGISHWYTRIYTLLPAATPTQRTAALSLALSSELFELELNVNRAAKTFAIKTEREKEPFLLSSAAAANERETLGLHSVCALENASRLHPPPGLKGFIFYLYGRARGANFVRAARTYSTAGREITSKWSLCWQWNLNLISDKGLINAAL